MVSFNGYKCRSEKFDFYLVGRKFEVETDHKPLISFLGEKDLLESHSESKDLKRES